MRKKKDVAAEVWKRSAAVNVTLYAVTDLCLEHLDSALTNNALYMENTNWERLIMYEVQCPTLAKCSTLLLESFAAVLRAVKTETLTRAVVELEEQAYVMESSPRSKTLVSLLKKSKNVRFASVSYLFHESCRLNICVPSTGVSLSMTLSEASQQQIFLTSNASNPPLTVPEMDEDVL